MIQLTKDFMKKQLALMDLLDEKACKEIKQLDSVNCNLKLLEGLQKAQVYGIKQVLRKKSI